MTADERTMLAAVLAPPRHRAELLRVRREIRQLERVIEGHPGDDVSRRADDRCDVLRARERELSGEDNLPRLIYADWIDERGDGPRAEFIRLQCELARMGPRPPCNGAHHSQCPGCTHKRLEKKLRRRERELLREHYGAWVAPVMEAFGIRTDPRYYGMHNLDARVSHESFRRGFVESITLDAVDWLAHWRAIRAAAPIRELTLSDIRAGVEGRRLFGSFVGLRRVRIADDAHTAGAWLTWWKQYCPEVEFELRPVDVDDGPSMADSILAGDL